MKVKGVKNEIKGLFCSCCFVDIGLHLYAGNAQERKREKWGKTIPDGKPFQELYRLITENRDLIESNEQDIEELKFDAAAINGRIDTVEADLRDVADQVALNTEDITAAFTRIASAEGDIGVLRADLDALAEQLQTDISLTNRKI